MMPGLVEPSIQVGCISKTLISGLNVPSEGLGGLGNNARGSRSLIILTGTSEALMEIIWKLVEGSEPLRNQSSQGMML